MRLMLLLIIIIQSPSFLWSAIVFNGVEDWNAPERKYHIRGVVTPECGEFVRISPYGAPNELAESGLDNEEVAVLQQFQKVTNEIFLDCDKILLVQLSPIEESAQRHIESFIYSIHISAGDDWSFIQKCPVDKVPMPAIQTLAAFKRMQYLDLFSIPMSSLTWQDIGLLEGLSYLGLPQDCNDVDLRAIGSLRQLEYLNCSDTQITGSGLNIVKDMGALKTLDLQHTTLVTDFVNNMTGSGIIRLLLTNSNITDNHLENIILLDRLEVLTLDHTMITPAILDQLEKMKNLRYVSLSNTSISMDDVDTLMARRPDLLIDLAGPKYYEQLVTEAKYFGAHLGDKKAQYEMLWQYLLPNMVDVDKLFRKIPEYKYPPKDAIELLKWYYVIMDDDKRDRLKTDKLMARAQEKNISIKDLEAALNPVEIYEARKRADFVMNLSKMNVSVELMLRQAANPYLPLYQYSFQKYGSK